MNDHSEHKLFDTLPAQKTEDSPDKLDRGAGGTTGEGSTPAHDLESSSAPNEDWGTNTSDADDGRD